MNSFWWVNVLDHFSLQALLHASVACRRKLTVDWISAEDLEDVTAKEVITIILLYCIC